MSDYGFPWCTGPMPAYRIYTSPDTMPIDDSKVGEIVYPSLPIENHNWNVSYIPVTKPRSKYQKRKRGNYRV